MFSFYFLFWKCVNFVCGKKKHFQAFLQNSQSVENFACFHGMEAPTNSFIKKLVCIIQGGF
jgi:hypothetical protein